MTDTTLDVSEYITDHYPDEEIVIADGLDAAFIGVGFSFTRPVACYDTEKVLQILMKDGMTYEEAQEYFDFNIVGAYVGENTPVFIDTPDMMR
jgi:hypothetical protein